MMSVTVATKNDIQHREIWRHVMPEHPEEVPAHLQFRVRLADLLMKYFPDQYIESGATNTNAQAVLDTLASTAMSEEEAKVFKDGIEAWRRLYA